MNTVEVGTATVKLENLVILAGQRVEPHIAVEIGLYVGEKKIGKFEKTLKPDDPAIAHLIQPMFEAFEAALTTAYKSEMLLLEAPKEPEAVL